MHQHTEPLQPASSRYPHESSTFTSPAEMVQWDACMTAFVANANRCMFPLCFQQSPTWGCSEQSLQAKPGQPRSASNATESVQMQRPPTPKWFDADQQHFRLPQFYAMFPICEGPCQVNWQGPPLSSGQCAGSAREDQPICQTAALIQDPGIGLLYPGRAWV